MSILSELTFTSFGPEWVCYEDGLYLKAKIEELSKKVDLSKYDAVEEGDGISFEYGSLVCTSCSCENCQARNCYECTVQEGDFCEEESRFLELFINPWARFNGDKDGFCYLTDGPKIIQLDLENLDETAKKIDEALKWVFGESSKDPFNTDKKEG